MFNKFEYVSVVTTTAWSPSPDCPDGCDFMLYALYTWFHVRIVILKFETRSPHRVVYTNTRRIQQLQHLVHPEID